ncbi:hypothetical protein M5J15_06770 [Serratia symbiotica]|uniref:hypothetical protein n=1 Tax=Serratia symbiotica TaxID=138074 RepID=UPI002091AF10|nr:hypothetical protein [Serratia symbiotica]MCX2957493.1 hypothetical protein [Serratia symbiotica]USS96546.1 hypothetical protein M5J15_06770 [Serratia symbiotica]
MPLLIGKLKKHGEAISQDIDQDALKKSLVENTDMTRQQVDQIVKNLVEPKNKTAELVNQRLDQAQVKINQAAQEYDELKQNARDQAAVAAEALSHAALWSFFALFIGEVISIYRRGDQRTGRVVGGNHQHPTCDRKLTVSCHYPGLFSHLCVGM